MQTQSQYLLASIVESSQDSIVSIDLNRIVTTWNRSAEILYGYTADEVIGHPLSMIMLPEDVSSLIDKVKDIIQEVTVPIYQTARIHKNGKEIDLEILLSPVRNGIGEVVGVSTIARDITKRKLHDQQKDEFISVASHELRTPLTAIQAYAEIIQLEVKRLGDESTIDLANKMLHQVRRLSNLTNTLLDTAKLSGGEIPLEIDFFNLSSLIKEQIEAFGLSSPAHSFTFKVGDETQVNADKRLIEQVLINLISNAVKYSPPGGEIVISLVMNDEKVEVGVQDFGIGIPVAQKDKIFERYFRASNRNRSASGIGLGLYVTAKIIRQHGGQIFVHSQEGKGSTFFFTLPIRPSDNLSNNLSSIE